MDQGYDWSVLSKTFRVNITAKAGIGAFNVEAGIEFMRQIKDTNYSRSINYYQIIQSDVTS